MRAALVPCSSCARHVRVDETSCPFCDAAVPANAADAIPRPPPWRGPVTRAALMFFGATAVGACSSGTVESPPADASSDGRVRDDGSPSALYGEPAGDAMV